MKTPRVYFKHIFFSATIASWSVWRYSIVAFLFFFSIHILIRLPLFFSTNFWFDGDEAVIGVMAQDVLKTGKIPFFFYGQRYGFATVETLFSAFWISLLGSKILALKLAGIAIHTFTTLFLSLALRAKKVSTNQHIFILCLVFLYPPFFLCASQMRTTAFLLAALLFFLTETKPFSWLYFLLVLVISFLLLEAQAMFFLFAMVFVVNWLWSSKNRWFSCFIFGFGLLVLLILLIFFSNQVEEVHAVNLRFGVDQIGQLWQQISGIEFAFSGFHYFTSLVAMPQWFYPINLALLAIILFLLVRWSFPLTEEKKRVFLFFGLAVLAYLFFLSGFEQYGPRYWINFFGGVLLLLIFLLVHSKKATKMSVSFFLWLLPFFTIIFVSPQMKVHFMDTNIAEKEAFQALEKTVFATKQKALFTTDVYLQWQWNYLHGNEIPCTSFNKAERTNQFLNRVEKQYQVAPSSVGLIGFWGLFLQMDYLPGFNDERQQVGEKYFLINELKPAYYHQGRKMAH